MPVDGEILAAPAPIVPQDLLIGRAQHSATRLLDGRVLVAGGAIPGDNSCCFITASAELYDPQTGKWSPAADMEWPRAGHTAILQSDGKVLAIGGISSRDGMHFGDLYDPVANSWSMAFGFDLDRQRFSATALLNGSILIAGGLGYPCPSCPYAVLSDARVYDRLRTELPETDDMHVARALHSSSLLNDGRVIVTGGYKELGATVGLESTEIYSPSLNKWSVVAPMSLARRGHLAATLPNGKAIVVGGAGNEDKPDNDYLKSAEVYDPADNSWARTSDLSSPHFLGVSVVLPSGHLLVIGGLNNSSETTKLVEDYDPASNTWSARPPLAIARRDHTATLLLNGDVLVVGGDRGAPADCCPAIRSVELVHSIPEPVCFDWTPSAGVSAGLHVVMGTPRNDVLIGTPGRDLIFGLAGKDTIRGLGGDDVICGGDDGDQIDSGDGNDALDGGDGNDMLSGGPGDDVLVGGRGDDKLRGGAGSDQLFGDGVSICREACVGGNDQLWGEDGPDYLVGDYFQVVNVDSHGGNDQLDGGAGDDVLLGDDVAIRVALSDTVTAHAGNDRLSGGPGNDVLIGDYDYIDASGVRVTVIEGDDILSGDDGADNLTGDHGGMSIGAQSSLTMGNDRLDGGRGDDVLIGDGPIPLMVTLARGKDVLLGGLGNDRLEGNENDDALDGGGGTDACDGGPGSDTAKGCEEIVGVP